MKSEFRDNINEIIADNKSGSAAILSKTIVACENYLNSSPDDKGILTSKLTEVFRQHSSMVLLFSFLNRFFHSIESQDKWQQRGLDFIEKYRNSRKDITENIAGNLSNVTDLTRKSILLHSNSSTVVEVFNNLAGRNIFPRIFQTVSGPVNEGQLQAQKLSDFGFNVKFISDTAVWKFIDEMDLAVFGADAVYEDYFVNKTGTALFAMAFRQQNKDVYILAEKGKLLNSQSLPPQLYKIMKEETAKKAEELWEDPPEGVEVRNYYFEDIPSHYAAKFISESDIFTADELKEHSARLQISNLFNFEEHPGF